MAIIYSYPTVTPEKTDLVLGTDVSANGKPTKNFTVQGIIDLVTIATGDLQTVLNLGNIAVAKDIILGSIANPSQSVYAASFVTTPTSSFAGTVGSGFTSIQSTNFVGNVSTPAQPDITSLGTLTSLSVNTSVTGTAVVTTLVAPGDNLKIASTKAIIDYIATKPSKETLFETLQASVTPADPGATPPVAEGVVAPAYLGNKGFDIDMGVTGVSNGNLLFGDNKRIKMGDFGVTYPFQMGYGLDSSNTNAAYIENATAARKMALESDILNLTSFTGTENYLTATKDNGVLLYYDNIKRLETIDGGALATGTLSSTGLLTAQADFWFKSRIGIGAAAAPNYGTSGQVLTSGGAGSASTWETLTALYSWIIDSDSNTPTTIPTGNTVDFAGGANIETEWDAPVDPLTKGTLTINATGLAKITGTPVSGEVAFWNSATSLNHSGSFKWLSGTVNDYGLKSTTRIKTPIFQGATIGMADTTATWQGSVMSGFTSITTVANAAIPDPTATPAVTNLNGFFGPLRASAASTNVTAGVADKAVQLSIAGAITTSGDVGLTGGPYNYTQGGNMTLATTIADSTIMGKVLSGYTAGTAGAIAATDTILDAFEKLQASITATTGLSYEGAWTPGTDATAGGTPDLRLAAAKVNGAFYICDADGTGTPNGDGTTPNSWKTGDWVIYVANGSATDEWQKLDQSNEVLGSGAANQYTMWSGTNNIGTGVISQSAGAGTKTVTIGNSANLTVEGNTILGDANTDTTTFKGPGTFEQTARLKTGLALGTATDSTEYGAANQVLTTGAASGNPPTWETPTTGVVESITGNYGITIAGTTADPTIAVTSDVNNLINQATAKATPVGADSILINDSAATNILKKATISSLPLDNYSGWVLAGDTGTPQTINSLDGVTFAGGTGVVTSTSATDTLTTALRYDDSDNAGTIKNFIEVAPTVAPAATDFLVFGDQAGSGAINGVKKASIASIVDLGNETLAEVLSNNNVTGNTNIVVQKNITFSDSNGTNSGNIIMGTGSDMSMGYNGEYGLELTSAAGSITGGIRMNSPLIQLRDLTSPNKKLYINALTADSVKIYYDGNERFKTTSTGVEVVNTDVNVPAALTLSQDSKTFTITNGLTGNPTLQTTGGSFNFRTDSSFIFKKQSNSQTYATISGTQTFSVDNQAGTNVVNALQLIQSTDATALKTKTRVYGDLQVDGNINHGSGGGTFNGNKDIDAGGVIKVFTLTRATTGCLAFDVFFTADFVSGNGGGPPIAEKWTVVHGSGQTPVYNKIISNDGQFGTGGYDVTFADASSGTAVECSVAKRSGSSYPSLSYTIIVGHSENNALTFTPA